MSILITCMFAVLIITPISTVAIGMAIQLNGVFVGTAAIGVAVITIVLTIHSLKTDKSGVTSAVALGSMKLMIPNPFCHPIILLLTLTTGITYSVPVALFYVIGISASTGFGLVGLVRYLASINAS